MNISMLNMSCIGDVYAGVNTSFSKTHKGHVLPLGMEDSQTPRKPP